MVRFPLLAIAFAVAVVTLLLVPSLGASGAPGGGAASGWGPAANVHPSDGTPVNLTFGPQNLTSPIFWGTTLSPRAPLLSDEGALVNATPTQVVVWPGANAGDDYNPLYQNAQGQIVGRIYIANGTNSAVSTNESQFVAWCKSIQCTAILQVPGEVNNASMAARIVTYTESTLNFRPAYWEIGNEPALWTQWNRTWVNWTRNPTLGAPLPSEYATEVKAYIAAMSAVDPSIQIIGLPGIGKGGGTITSQWIQDVIATNEPSANLAGIAIHIYPAGDYTLPTVPTTTQFYYAIDNSTVNSVLTRVTSAVGIVHRECKSLGTCTTTPALFVTEVGTSLSHQPFGVFSSGFPGALGAAVEAVQAMEYGAAVVKSFDVFATVSNTNNSWFSLSGVPRPSYTVYTQILDHLASHVTSIVVSGLSSNVSGNVTAVQTVDKDHGNRTDLLVINTDTNSPVTFTPQFNGGAVGAQSVESWSWSGTNVSVPYGVVGGLPQNATSSNATTPAPVANYSTSGLPTTFTLPPQSLVLFEAYPLPRQTVNVTFRETQLPSGTLWLVNRSGQFTATNATNFTLLLPYGSQTLTAPTLPVGLRYNLSLGRYAPIPSPYNQSFLVNGSTPPIVIPYQEQWNVNATSREPAEGSVSPGSTWANNSTALTLSATPAPGNAFQRWFGSGPGNYSGPDPSATVVPTGPLTEKANFSTAFPVTFTEAGLPAGTNWSVAVHYANLSSVGSSIALGLGNGTYGFQVPNITGFTMHRSVYTIHVVGGPVTIPIVFTPPSTNYTVTFQQTVLPTGSLWWVTVLGVNTSSTGTSLSFVETNGSHGFQAGTDAPNWRAPHGGSFDVQGASLNVVVDFNFTGPPPTYALTIREAGIPASQASWWVDLDQQNISVTGASATVYEPNGSYYYHAGTNLNYAVPAGAHVDVAGQPLVLTVQFGPRFTVEFEESGLVSGVAWNVTIWGVTLTTRGSSVTFTEANGTYWYSIPPVPGYHLSRPGQTLNVSGSAVVVPLQFTSANPALTPYAVELQETGLPGGAGWSITIRGASNESNGPTMTFFEPNGTYGFQATGPAGYRPALTNDTFTIRGAAVQFTIPFAAVDYPVVWQETGLAGGLSWVVAIDNITVPATGSWVSDALPNGSHSFTIPGVQDYVPSPATGEISVQGPGIIVEVHFVRASFAVTFSASGLPGGDTFVVRFSGDAPIQSVASIAFETPNGTYSYDVVAPANYFASPSHGNITVRGVAAVITINFLPTGRGPAPPVWSLVLPAATVFAALALSGVGVFALMGALRRRRTGASP